MSHEEDLAPREQQEAEVLAEALEGKAGDPQEPPQAVAAARLMEIASSEFSKDRADAVWAKVTSRLQEHGQTRSPLVQRWFFPLGAAAAVVCLVFFILFVHARIGIKLPEPRSSLLFAQAHAAAGKDTAELDKQMRQYRDRMFADLDQKLKGGS